MHSCRGQVSNPNMVVSIGVSTKNENFDHAELCLLFFRAAVSVGANPEVLRDSLRIIANKTID